MNNQPKQIIILAGPNGAGKTTFARSFLPQEANCTRFINADLIAAGLSPFSPELAAIKADRLMLEEIREAVAKGHSFALETTLSGLGYTQHIPKWRKAGYKVTLYFLSLPNAEMAVQRVACRVSQGSHNIPEPVIRRRFAAGLENFHYHYKQLVDAWMLYQNDDLGIKILDWSENHE